MIKNSYPSETADRFMVRMPDGMRDRIAELAKASGRSMNAEIVARLQETIDRPATSPTELLDERLTRILEENIGVRRQLDKQLELMTKLASGKFTDDAEHPKTSKKP